MGVAPRLVESSALSAFGSSSKQDEVDFVPSVDQGVLSSVIEPLTDVFILTLRVGTSAQKAAGGMPCPPKTGLCPCNYWCDDKPYYTNNPAFLNNLGGSNGAKEACGANSPSPLVGYCEGS